MSNMPPGTPMGRAVVVSATTTSAIVQNMPMTGAQYQVEITNVGSGTAYVEIDVMNASGALTAIVPTSGRCSLPILAGQTKVYTIGGMESLAVVSESTSTVIFQPLNGE
jgi:hypothetical protein